MIPTCFRTLLIAALLLVPALSGLARETVITRDRITLDFVDAHNALTPALQDAVVETFFATYPRLRADFNPAAPDAVRITIDPDYVGIAFVDGEAMTINPRWFDDHPYDLDLVTHESMHIVQAYGRGDAPGWLVEGIADYARAMYGLDNAAAGWALPTTVGPAHRFDSGYRVTGAFLAWAEARYPGLVHGLDAALRAQRYTPDEWVRLTGGTVDAAWAAYAADRTPVLDAP